jgi:hypothetical protein
MKGQKRHNFIRKEERQRIKNIKKRLRLESRSMEKLRQESWCKIWQSHLDEYLQSPPRAGIFISNYLPSIRNALEIACGSSKDSIYLSKKGIFVVATDYEPRVIRYLKNHVFLPNLFYQISDAFRLPFKENTFDVVFHNGFFVCFNNNEDLYTLLKEQERVSRRYIFFFVHNKLNSRLLNDFYKRAKIDPLYAIRFFDPEEILSIINKSGINFRSLKILKFGGYVDFGVFKVFSKKFRKFIPGKLYQLMVKIFPRLYQTQPWAKTERIACLIELDKR